VEQTPFYLVGQKMTLISLYLFFVPSVSNNEWTLLLKKIISEFKIFLISLKLMKARITTKNIL
jgi:hypothetical protein